MNRAHWDREPHGTEAAYRRHYRNGEKPCQRCRDAAALAKRVRYRARQQIPPGRWRVWP